MRNWADTQGAYRFLNNETVTHEQIMMPHWIQTRSEAEQRSQVRATASKKVDSLNEKEEKFESLFQERDTELLERSTIDRVTCVANGTERRW